MRSVLDAAKGNWQAMHSTSISEHRSQTTVSSERNFFDPVDQWVLQSKQQCCTRPFSTFVAQQLQFTYTALDWAISPQLRHTLSPQNLCASFIMTLLSTEFLEQQIAQSIDGLGLQETVQAAREERMHKI
jgi:hypothetical protein